ncbi:outer membrane beta-barrel protein [Craterilacuibacter sp.]|uniref:outer membrane beta-barrel protein n=1 Tax=Craterilacuibacter sp. TaxID=2870909 RepID=UPI003F321D28
MKKTSRYKKQYACHPLLRHGVLYLLFAGACSAYADDLDTVKFRVGTRLTHDSNLFGSEQDAKSDWLARTEVGVSIDKYYSLQHLKLDFSAVDYRYSEFDNNNFIAYPYDVGWKWVLGSRLRGDFLLRHEEVPDLLDPAFSGDSINIKRSDLQRASLSWQALQRVYLLAGIDSTKTDYSQNSFSVNEKADTADLGLRYQTPAGNALQFVVRDGRGTEQENRDFDQRSYLVAVNWQLGGKTSLDAGLGRIKRSYDDASLDYSGSNGYAVFNWKATDKLELNVSIKRDIDSQQIFSSRTTDTFSIEPSLQISSKIRLFASLLHSAADYKGAPAGIPQRNDKTDIASIGSEWRPFDPLTLTATMQHEKRNTTDPYPSYRRQQYWLGVALGF